MIPQWLAEHRIAGEVVFRIGRDGEHFVAEWLGSLRIVARRDGTVVSLVESPEADARDLEKIKNGGVRLLLRHLRGQLAFHGACVRFASGSLALLGRSGQGKSTLAAALCARHGGALMSDDALVMEERAGDYAVTASETDHWLDSVARSALGLAGAMEVDRKIPVASKPADASSPSTLLGLIDLEFDDDVGRPTLGELRGIEALAILVPQVVRFVLDEPDVQRREIESLSRLVERVPILRLRRPRRIDLLDATAALAASFAIGRGEK